jgi:hypothetical protein
MRSDVPLLSKLYVKHIPVCTFRDTLAVLRDSSVDAWYYRRYQQDTYMVPADAVQAVCHFAVHDASVSQHCMPLRQAATARLSSISGGRPTVCV